MIANAVHMKTYLLTWQIDSKNERNESDFKNIAAQLVLGTTVEEIDWSTGNRSHMEVGSQVFFCVKGRHSLAFSALDGLPKSHLKAHTGNLRSARSARRLGM